MTTGQLELFRNTYKDTLSRHSQSGFYHPVFPNHQSSGLTSTFRNVFKSNCNNVSEKCTKPQLSSPPGWGSSSSSHANGHGGGNAARQHSCPCRQGRVLFQGPRLREVATHFESFQISEAQQEHREVERARQKHPSREEHQPKRGQRGGEDAQGRRQPSHED